MRRTLFYATAAILAIVVVFNDCTRPCEVHVDKCIPFFRLVHTYIRYVQTQEQNALMHKGKIVLHRWVSLNFEAVLPVVFKIQEHIIPVPCGLILIFTINPKTSRRTLVSWLTRNQFDMHALKRGAHTNHCHPK